ncbi:hypothetical protein [Rhodoferax ferrireducens]|uniref:hypothetical protein n=1 Tax=Rhodoferax ferrireducens TaxID=192843 RepID=UPI003BB4CF15
MNTIPRNLPRFVPTLTEVVEPSSLIRAAPSTSPDVEEIIQSVMQRVDRVLDRRLREDADAMLRNMMTEQLHTLQLSLRAELALVVQQAVAEAMALREDEH